MKKIAITTSRETINETRRKEISNNSMDFKNIAVIFLDPSNKYSADTLSQRVKKLINSGGYRDGLPVNYYGNTPNVSVLSREALESDLENGTKYDAVIVTTHGSLFPTAEIQLLKTGVPTFYWKAPDHTHMVSVRTTRGITKNIYGCFREITGISLAPSTGVLTGWSILPLEPIPATN